MALTIFSTLRLSNSFNGNDRALIVIHRQKVNEMDPQNVAIVLVAGLLIGGFAGMAYGASKNKKSKKRGGGVGRSGGATRKN